MKEEMKKYFNIKIYELEEEKRSIYNNYFTYREILEQNKEKTQEEREKALLQYQEEQKERENKLQTINDKIDILTIEKNILYNNIIYIFYIKYHDIITNILNKYNNKNIGEKTKQKIQEEIKEELKKDNIFSSVYFSFGSYSCDIYNLSFSIYRNEEEQKNYSFNFLSFKYELCNYYNEEEKEKYKNYFVYRNEKTGSIIIHNNKLWENENYNYIEYPGKEAKNILKECKKSMEKVNKLIEQAKKEREKHNQLLNYYKINEFDNIKINYQQTL